jgi:2-oxoisovalerate dehydrogenase E2 component (dihydrolipoyl transacylase)
VGDRLAIGTTLVVLETEAAAPSEPVEAPSPPAAPPSQAPEAKARRSPARAGRVSAPPAVRKRARDLGIALADVPSAGEHVTHADLDAFLMRRSGGSLPQPTPSRSAEPGDEQIPIAGLRRKIAEAMAESKRRIPHFYYVEEVDMTALEALRAETNGDRKDRLTPLPFLIVAMCRALADFPQINATFDDDAGIVTRHAHVHMGVATQTDGGLMVPVIRNAQERDLAGIASEIGRLAEGARSGRLAREELLGSTITISSLGPLGGIASGPVINRPEVAIVAVNKIGERLVPLEGDTAIRKLMNLSCAFDHRVVDGWDAASFIARVKALLEDPKSLL